MFDNVPLALQMVGAGPEAQRVADQISETFLAFARSGKPLDRHIPAWPTYDLFRRATLVFDVPPRIVDDPRGDERRLFSKVPYVQPGT